MPDDPLRIHREAAIADLLDVEQDVDVARLTNVFPHPRYELIGNSRVYDGIEVCARYLKERRNAFPDYRAEPIALYHADDAVIAEAWVTGTHVGQIEAIEPSGKGFRFRMAAFFLFEGETLVCVRNYFDHAAIARQLA
jgi:predicted ester cyclase